MEPEELPDTQGLPATQQLTQCRSMTGVSPGNEKQMGVLRVDFEIPYPIKMGATVIGRDPMKCDIVIDDESISKMHAIIRIKSPNTFFLIDMKSTNGTKKKSKPLNPHFATPIEFGDILQFGSVYAVLERAGDGPAMSSPDLPMTQVIETPTVQRSVLGTQRQITVPESPDVSDKDDSFLMPCKPLPAKSVTPKNQLTGGGNTNDSLFWKAPSRSPSLKFDLDDSTNSLNCTDTAIPKIHKEVMEVPINDMETQLPEGTNIEIANIHTLGTQLPEDIGIHTMETQIPEQPTIHSLETQSSILNKIHNMETQISEEVPQNVLKDENTVTEVKEVSIYDAQTQIINDEHEINPNCGNDKTNKSISESDEEIIFDEFDTQGFEIPNSQPLLNESPRINAMTTINTEVSIQSNSTTSVIKINEKNKAAISYCKDFDDDEDLTDCDEDVAKEIVNKENVTNLMISSMNLTGTCSNLNVLQNTPISISQKNKHKYQDCINSATSSCQQIPEPLKRIKSKPILTKSLSHNNAATSKVIIQTINESEEDISDALTQVIETKDLSDEPTQVITKSIEDVTIGPEMLCKSKKDASDEIKKTIPTFMDDADAPTQVITDQTIPTIMDDADAPTQIITDQNNFPSPFKIPSDILSESSICLNKSNVSKVHLFSKSSQADPKVPILVAHQNFYDCTQDVMDDLLTQRQGDKEKILSPFKVPTTLVKRNESQNRNRPTSNNEHSKSPANYYQSTQDLENDLVTQNIDIVPSSQEDDIVGERFPHITKPLKPLNHPINISDTNAENDRLSTQKIKDIIGVSEDVVSKTDSTTDTDDTPKKTIGFYDDLPLSEDIVQRKGCGSALIDSGSTMSEDEKSADENSESDSPIVFRKRKTTKNDVKINLLSRLNLKNLPTRISSRTRKPSEKVKDIPKLHETISIKLENLDIIRDNLEKIKGHKSKHNQADQTSNEKTERKKSKSNHISDYTNVNPTEDKNRPNQISTATRNQNSNLKSNQPRNIKSELNVLEIQVTTKHSKPLSKISGNKYQEVNKIYIERRLMESEGVISTDSDENIKQPPERKNRQRGKNIKKIETKNVKNTNSVATKTDSDNSLSSVKTGTGKVVDEHSTEVRRSSRKKNSVECEYANNTPINKTKVPNVAKQSLNKTKKSEDTSRVYSINEHSRDSSSTKGEGDAPKSKRTSRRKRAAEEVVITPSKKLRSSVPVANDTDSPLLRPQRVLFTAYNDERMKEMLVKLGAVVVDDVKDCTVVVTKEIKRTFKFLCAVGLGRPIVGDEWVKACKTKKSLADPWAHILEDVAAEKKYKFSLRRTLKGARNFLAGHRVSCTPSIEPKQAEMKLIVECSGGVYGEGGPRWVAMSDLKDRALWAGLRRRGATLVTREFVLTGVLRQELDSEAHALR